MILFPSAGEGLPVGMDANIPLSGVDKGFFLSERADHPMTVASCWLFHQPLDKQDVLDHVNHMVTQFPRFRMRLSTPGHAWWPNRTRCWEPYPNFVLADHVTETTLPDEDNQDLQRSDSEMLQETLAELFSRPWDESRPLWHMDLLHYGACRSALFVRLHHSMTDGQGAVYSLLSITRKADDPETTPTAYGQNQPPVKQTWMQTLLMVWVFLLGAIQSAFRIVYLLVFFRRHNMRGKITRRKVIRFSDDISMEQVKAIKNAFGVTVNDVLMSAVTFSMRRYVEHYERKLVDRYLVGFIPFSMRKPGDHELGNKLAATWIYLPFDVADPIARLREVSDCFTARKQAAEIYGAYLYGKILGHLPVFTVIPHQRFVHWVMDNPHMIATNVPGPRDKLTFAGKTIDSFVIFAPQPGEGSLGISLISYGSKIACSLVFSQDHLVDNGDSILQGVVQHVQDLYDLIP